jgi:hypothetical protein
MGALAGSRRGADRTAGNWVELESTGDEILVLRLKGKEHHITGGEQWWLPHNDRIQACLKSGRVLVFLREGRVEALQLIHESGAKTMIRRPWRLW